jgi:hypothetical protein
MKTILTILAIIALPSVGLIASSATGIVSFGATFLICLIVGYIAARQMTQNDE